MTKIFNDNSIVAVHPNPHHADDVFCVACVLIMNPNVKIIRTRNKEELEKVDFRIDVGGKYDPNTGDYDHHQNDFNERHANPNEAKHKKGPKYCAFSLIWRHYATDIIKAILLNLSKATNKEWNITDDIIDYINQSIEETLVASIGAMDNGEQKTYYLDTGSIRLPTIVKFIQNYNPCTWIEGWDHDRFFFKAVNMAITYLEREVIKLYGQVQAVDPVLEAVDKAKDGIMILNQYLPWGPVFTRFPFDTKDIKMVMYPSTEGWMFQSPLIKMLVDKDRFQIELPNGERRKYRYIIPTNLWGADENRIKEITGIDDGIFIHATGFVGGTKTKEAAIALCNYIINNQEY